MQYTHGLKPEAYDVGRGCTCILRNMSSKAYIPRHDRGKMEPVNETMPGNMSPPPLWRITSPVVALQVSCQP